MRARKYLGLRKGDFLLSVNAFCILLQVIQNKGNVTSFKILLIDHL